jgi:transposase
VRKRGTTIARLRMLVGHVSSEKTADVLNQQGLGPVPDGTGPADSPDPGGAGAAPGDGKDASAPGAAPTEVDGGEKNADKQEQEGEEAKGHGRLPASAYTAAQHIAVSHENLCPGDQCPGCERGKVYELREPAPFLRIVGQAPLAAICWDLEQMRCGACGKVYTAKPPDEALGPKTSETATAMIGVLHYGSGMPFNRLDHLQHDLETPVPASTQWDAVNDGADTIRPAYKELERLAAQGFILHDDDTHMRTLAFMGKRRAALLKSGQLPDPDRTGLFTTGVVSIAKSDRAIALFFTGRKHAGENLTELLLQRDADLPPPILMSDALARNVPVGPPVLEANCLPHGRRKFVDEVANFPVEVRYVLEQLRLVFKVEKRCKKDKLSDDERLLVHQRESGPVMDHLQQWMRSQLDDKRVEPNSGLGKAMNYMLKNWDKLTLFLRVPGAPIDNNICERALKKAIRHRNNSLFYRSERGAYVGDMYMSIIHTAELHGVNAFHYLTTLLRHPTAIAENPADWLPWNYRDALERLNVANAA